MNHFHIRTLEQLMPYQKTWDHILEENNNDNPFIEFPWVENWWRYIGEKRNVELIVVEKNNRIIGFFPFHFTRKWDTTLIEFIARGEANYMDFIVYDDEREETIRFVFNTLMETMPKCIFNLHGLLSSSPTTNMLSLYLAKRKCEPTVFSVVTPFINMEAVNLEAYMKKRRKIHGLDRREKRLRYLGEVKVATSHPNEIDQVFSMHERHWRYKLDTSGFTNDDNKNFHRALVNISDGPMQAKVESLYLDNQMIAFSYGFMCRGRYIGYIIGHDDDYGIYGPGTILDKELIVSSPNRAIRKFDLSIGYEPYKFEWNTAVDYTNNFMFSSDNWKTRMIFLFVKGKGQIKETLKKNYKIVLFKREFVGRKYFFIKHAKLKEWVNAVWKLARNIYSRKSIDIYKQTQGNETLAEFELLVYPKAKKRHHNLSRINKRFYNGFAPYRDSKFSMFWIHPKLIRVDEVDYLQPLPKQSAFIAEWQFHNLSNICSYLRHEENVKDIFLYTSGQDEVVKKHLDQLGFVHVNRIKKIRMLSKSTTHVSTSTTTKE
jgi:CelD/BcsL family acetyltransferase involved in cellulose biosynthesis